MNAAADRLPGALRGAGGPGGVLAESPSSGREPLRFAAGLFRSQGRAASGVLEEHVRGPLSGTLERTWRGSRGPCEGCCGSWRSQDLSRCARERRAGPPSRRTSSPPGCAPPGPVAPRSAGLPRARGAPALRRGARPRRGGAESPAHARQRALSCLWRSSEHLLPPVGVRVRRRRPVPGVRAVRHRVADQPRPLPELRRDQPRAAPPAGRARPIRRRGSRPARPASGT